MRPRYAAVIVASLFGAAAVLTAGAWRRHGNDELARLAKAARSDLRDAVKADKEVVRHYVYDTWPYWWGYPRYGWWEERNTIIYAPEPAPQRAPQRRVEAGGVSPTVNVEAPRVETREEGRATPAPLPRVRRLVPRL